MVRGRLSEPRTLAGRERGEGVTHPPNKKAAGLGSDDGGNRTPESYRTSPDDFDRPALGRLDRLRIGLVLTKLSRLTGIERWRLQSRFDALCDQQDLHQGMGERGVE